MLPPVLSRRFPVFSATASSSQISPSEVWKRTGEIDESSEADKDAK